MLAFQQNKKIWDTAGQEKYHSLAPMYYRGAAAAIVVYDITRAESFKTLQNWIKELRQCGPEGIIIAIAGNKADLEDKREVQSDMAKRYAQKLEDERGMGQSALFFETSAKEDLNVKAIFEMISKSTRGGRERERERGTPPGEKRVYTV